MAARYIDVKRTEKSRLLEQAMTDEKLTVFYPNGNVRHSSGKLVKRDVPNSVAGFGAAITIQIQPSVDGHDISAASPVLLDPRCVVAGKRSGVLYSPRLHLDQLGPEINEWLELNPDWPGALEDSLKPRAVAYG